MYNVSHIRLYMMLYTSTLFNFTCDVDKKYDTQVKGIRKAKSVSRPKQYVIYMIHNRIFYRLAENMPSTQMICMNVR